MSQVAHCPTCGKTLGLQEEWRGKSIRCPACRDVFVVGTFNPPVLDVLPADAAREKQPSAKPDPGGSRTRRMAASAWAAVPPSFTVAVKDPQGVWKGRFQAQLSSQGLT